MKHKWLWALGGVAGIGLLAASALAEACVIGNYNQCYCGWKPTTPLVGKGYAVADCGPTLGEISHVEVTAGAPKQLISWDDGRGNAIYGLAQGRYIISSGGTGTISAVTDGSTAYVNAPSNIFSMRAGISAQE